MKVENNCKNCNRFLGYLVYGDILCKCDHYNIIRPNQETSLRIKSLYIPMATVPSET